MKPATPLWRIFAACRPGPENSIISRGRAGGYTLKLPIATSICTVKTEYLEEIAGNAGGFYYGKEIFNEVTTGDF